jgi:hypothetical protein
MRRSISAALAAAVMLGLAACASGPTADVSRFHSNQPISRGTVYLQAANPAVAGSLEARTHGETVAVEMRRLGFQTVQSAEQAQFIATIGVTQEDADLPSGRRGTAPRRTTTLNVQLKEAGSNTPVWEGRASQTVAPNSREADLTVAIPALAGALFGDFPGTPGVTQQVRI